MTNYKLKIHGSSFLFTVFLISYHFQFSCNFWVTSELLTQLCGALGISGHVWPDLTKKLVEIFFLYWLSAYMLKSMWSSDSTRDIWSNIWSISDFPAINQEQEISQLGDLYKKIDNNITFYLWTFSAKIKNRIYHINYKSRFWTIFGDFCCGDFSWKICLCHTKSHMGS